MLNIKIRHREQQRDELIALSGIKSRVPGPSRTGYHSSGMSYVEKYVDMSREIDRMVFDYQCLKDRIITEIHSLDNPAYCEVLYLRYVRLKTYEQIAEDTYYSVRYIYKMHDKALLEFEHRYPSILTE